MTIKLRLTLLVTALIGLLLLAMTANLMGRKEGAARLHAIYAERIEPLKALKAGGDGTRSTGRSRSRSRPPRPTMPRPGRPTRPRSCATC